MQNNDKQKIITNILNKILGLDLEQVKFKNIEKYTGISEYDFYLINLIGITKKGKEKEIFIKSIKKGKIKESLFCICDLTYEKYYEEKSKKLKKISIIETNENLKNISKVSVKLFEDNLNFERANIEIYFIEMSKFLKNIKERIENIEISPKDIIIIGVETGAWFIVKNLL